MSICSCCQCSCTTLMLWRKKNGEDTFTGCIMIQEPDTNTAWTDIGRPNIYKLKDFNNIDGPRTLLTPREFVSEMQQYD